MGWCGARNSRPPVHGWVMATKVCPDGTTLEAFSLGRLENSQWQAVAEHLEACGECQERLESFDGADDGLMTQLRQLPSDASHSNGVVQIVADAGRDLARRLADGPVRLDRFELEA